MIVLWYMAIAAGIAASMLGIALLFPNSFIYIYLTYFAVIAAVFVASQADDGGRAE